MNKNNSQLCPNCTEPIPVYDGYITWCHRCHWNLNPNKTTPPNNKFKKLYSELSEKYAKELSKQMNDAYVLKPKLSLSMVATYTISLLIHSITMVLAVISIILILNGWPRFSPVVLGIILLLISFYLIPKPYKFDKKTSCKNKYPELFSLINDIAKTLNAPKIDDLVVNESFNASYAQYGIRRKRVITIGMPLFNILSDEEKVAVISHELSHGLNKDIQRNYIVFTALKALRTWYYLVAPKALVDRYGKYTIFTIPANLLLLGISKIIYGLYYIIESLSWYDSQKAEYLADYYATKGCGSAAIISLLNKLCFRKTLNVTLTSHVAKKLPTSLLDELNKNIQLVPEREIERLKLLEIDENARFDMDHPPILYRIEFLNKHYIYEKAYVITGEKSLKLKEEFKKNQPTLEEKMIENYKSRLLY